MLSASQARELVDLVYHDLTDGAEAVEALCTLYSRAGMCLGAMFVVMTQVPRRVGFTAASSCVQKTDRLSHLLCHVQLRVPHVVIFRRTLRRQKSAVHTAHEARCGNLTFRGHNSTSLLPMRATPSTRNVWCLLPVFEVGAVHGLYGFTATRGTVLGLHLQTPLRR